jgi:hypothetical protein
MHWTDTYSHERDMEYRLRDNHGDAHHRRLRRTARGAGGFSGRAWLNAAQDGLGRSAGVAMSAAADLRAWYNGGSEPQGQCC